ncbi:NUDIX domain-containing protein [Candidatus Gottesmanbacteria bacterium]|nr:NUDIX domain-containing protein [Candidatus Gottesmanbacteria bacterium]MBI5465347.1 NUDIX domain-containing protein [Candidatus Gottesmanbacteria bacterium]
MKMKNRQRYLVAVHVFLIKNGRILLSRRQNTGFEDGKFSVPSGHLEKGETVIETAKREAKEEVGINLKNKDIKFAGVMHRKSNDERIDFFFKVSKWQKKLFNAEPEKCSELLWVSPKNLPKDTVPYIREAIKNYLQKLPFSCFGF